MYYNKNRKSENGDSKKMQKEKMRIRISDTKENGDGFARVEGMAVFVPGLVTGDIAEICVEE
ncbi:MAG: TRAM domain-containing protein, partial [Eubacteriales bacterium]